MHRWILTISLPLLIINLYGNDRPYNGAAKIGVFQAFFRHYPGQKRITVELIPNDVKSNTVNSVIINSEGPGNIRKSSKAVKNQNGSWKGVVDIGDTSSKLTGKQNKWVLGVALHSAKGELLAENRNAFELSLKKWTWENLNLGISNEVIPPFTPLKVDADSVRCIMRNYQFNGFGLWDQVDSRKKTLLASPMTLKCVINGKSAKWQISKPVFLKKSSNEVIVKGTAVADGLTWSAVSTVDYDGFMWIRATLKCDKKTNVDKLTVSLPMRSSEARLMHAVSNSIRKNKAGLIPQGNGIVWDSANLDRRPIRDNKKFSSELLPYLWIGGEEQGICWLADCEKGFSLKEKVPSVRIVRTSKQTLTVELDLINQPAIIDKKRILEFGFQATPVKPLPNDWKNWYFNFGRNRIEGMRHISFCLHPHGNGTNFFGNKYPPNRDYSFIKNLKRITETRKADPDVVNDWVKKSAKSYEEYVRSQMDYYRKKTQYADKTDEQIIKMRFGTFQYFCKKSVNVAVDSDHLIPYTDPRVQYKGLPEYLYFGAEWWCPQGEWSGTSRVYPAESYIDYLLFNYRDMLKNGFDGIYLDDTYILPGDNPDSGSAKLARSGEIYPKMGMLAMRQLIKRLAVMQHKMGISPRLTTVHMTNALLIPVFSFADISFDWEMNYGDQDFQERFPLDFIRTESTGRQAGLVPTVCNGLRNKKQIKKKEWEKRCKELTRSTMGLTLLHEIRQNQLSDKNLDFKFIHKIYSLLKHFGTSDSKCIFAPYWQSKRHISILPSQFKLSYYSAPGKILLIILNTGKKAEAKIIFDRAALNIPYNAAVIDVETGSKLSFDPIKVAVEDRDFKLIYIGSNKEFQKLGKLINQ